MQTRYGLVAGLLLLMACGQAGGPCDGNATALGDGVCLAVDDALAPHQALIEAEVRRTFDRLTPVMPVGDLRVTVRADASRVIPEIGMGGFNPAVDEVLLYLDPRRADVADVIQAWLPSQLAHEVHHARRRRSVGYGATLHEAAVSEGLADQFSVELTGIAPPPWSTALTGDALATWVAAVREAPAGPYDHARWFFGTTPDVPRWTGYTVGFALIQAYLARHPDARAATLVDSTAAAIMAP